MKSSLICSVTVVPCLSADDGTDDPDMKHPGAARNDILAGKADLRLSTKTVPNLVTGVCRDLDLQSLFSQLCFVCRCACSNVVLAPALPPEGAMVSGETCQR